MRLRDLGQSIAVRLSMLYALASAIILCAFGVYLYSALESAIATRQQIPVTAMAGIVRNMMDDIPSLERLREEPQVVGHILAGHPRMKLWIYGEDGDTLFSSSSREVPKEAWHRLAPSEAGGVGSDLWAPERGSVYRLGVVRYDSARSDVGRGTIVLALDVSEPRQMLGALKASILVAVPAAMGAVALFGILIARRGLRPIARVADSARRVTLRNLSERLDLRSMPPELQPLAGSFNAMLGRLEDAFERLSDFSADLAHELRTPLTSLLGRTQVILSQERSAGDYREAMELSVGELERLSAIVSDMLFLARADHAPSALHYETVDLRREVNRLIEFLGVAADERGIKLRASGNAIVRADRMMLDRALSNVLSNAIRHSPDRASVDVDITRIDGGSVVTVTDRGPGIPPGHVDRIFDRFYRADPSRARSSGGTGLGLAIARSIMRMHHGDITVHSEPGKATAFALSIPDRTPSASADGSTAPVGDERPPLIRKMVARETHGSAA